MSHEGDEGVKGSGRCPEDVNTLSPHNGKRCRNEREESLLPAASDLDLQKEAAPDNDDRNGGETKDTADENFQVSQTGKRAKYEDNTKDQSITGNMNTPKDVNKVPEDCVAETVLGKAEEYASGTGIGEDSQFYCTTCSVKCTSVKDYNTHAAGKRHQRALMGIVTRPGKNAKKFGIGSKTKLSATPKTPASHEDVSTEQKIVVVDGSVGNVNQDGKCPSSSYKGCADLGAADLLSPGLKDGKDVPMEQENSKEKIFMEPTTSKIALDNCGNGCSHEPQTDRGIHETLLKLAANVEGQHVRSIMDLTSCKGNSDCVTQALRTAFQACACPGHDSLLRTDAFSQAAGSTESLSVGAVSSNTMVSMHPQCFMNFLHDVQMKALEDFFQRVVHESRGFKLESWLPVGAPGSAPLPAEKDLNCTICRVEYGSKSDLNSHVSGKKHTSLMTRLHSRCHVCNINCNSEQEFEKHISGKKHASKLRLVQKRVAL